MGIVARRALIYALAAAAVACGTTAEDQNVAARSEPTDDCVPSADLLIEPLTDGAQRFENVEEYLTGYWLDDLPEGDSTPNTNSNWGGVWGDFAGGMVVAVLDCSVVDVDEIARLAGPTGQLRIIEVPYTFAQVTEFRDSLGTQLTTAEIGHDILIESTLAGRHIEVRVRDIDALPDDFGRAIPGDVYTVVATDDLFEET